MSGPLTAVAIRRLTDGDLNDATDQVATEEPLAVTLAGVPWQTILRTPGADRALLLGLLFAESLIESAEDVLDIRSGETATSDFGNCLDVKLRVPPAVAPMSRVGVRTSACGMCGQTLIDAMSGDILQDPAVVAASMLTNLPGILRERQELFSATGGIHAAGLFTPTGELLALAEDVGRHNAVDKVMGLLLDSGLTSLPGTILQISGRGGYEILQKAWRGRIPIVAAVGAPSSLAVQLADRAGITLVGFMRGERANFYTHPDRIVAGAAL